MLLFENINFLCFSGTIRRSTEISLVIRQTMEACILTHLMPRSQVFFRDVQIDFFFQKHNICFLSASFWILQIDIFVQVLQADGGSLYFNHMSLLMIP